MRLSELAPSPNERGLIVGTTGSGKSVLAKNLLSVYRYVLAVDTKQTLGSGDRGGGGMSGYALATSPGDLERMGKRYERLQYRPEFKFQNPDDLERIYSWVFRRGNTFLYTDELFDIHHFNVPPPSFRRCITSGRELGIGMLHATQRPRRIDPVVWTESEKFYVFKMRHPDDRRLLSGRIGDGALPPFGFFYTHDVEPFEPPVVRRLRL